MREQKMFSKQKSCICFQCYSTTIYLIEHKGNEPVCLHPWFYSRKKNIEDLTLNMYLICQLYLSWRKNSSEQLHNLRLYLCWIYLKEEFHNRRNSLKHLTLFILDSFPFLIIHPICATLKFPWLHSDKEIGTLQDPGLSEKRFPIHIHQKPNPCQTFFQNPRQHMKDS